MNNQNPFLRGHPRYHQENRNFTDLSHRRVRDAVASVRAPANFGREIVYFYAYLHLVFVIIFSIDRRQVQPNFARHYFNVFFGSMISRDILTAIWFPFYGALLLLITGIQGRQSYHGVSLNNGYAGTFMIAIYLAFRYLRRNQRQGGSNKTQSKRKGINKTQSKRKDSNKKESLKLEDVLLDLQDLSTKTETHISGTVKVGDSNLDKETENEILKFIKENLIKMNANQYKMSLSGLDLIISIEGDNITFDTEFSDKAKFDKISKEIFEMNKSLYSGITEQDIHNKIDEFSKMNLELKMKSEMKSEMKSKKQGGRSSNR